MNIEEEIDLLEKERDRLEEMVEEINTIIQQLRNKSYHIGAA